MRRLAYKELPTCALTTGLTSDLGIVNWSQLSGFLYLCWELGCRVHCRVHPHGKDKCIPYFTLHTVHTHFPQFSTYKYMQTQYATLCGFLRPWPSLLCTPPTAEQSLLEPNHIELFLLLVSFATTEALH